MLAQTSVMQYFSALLGAFFFSFSCSFSQTTLSATYTVADLPSSFNVFDPGCSNATLSVTLPAGGNYQVTNTNVAYLIQATGGGNRSEQRSQLVFQNTNTAEAVEASGTGGAGFQSYSRNTTIGNGIYSGGTTLTFLLQVKRTAEVIPGCNTSVQKVINSSWVITVSYVPAYSNIPVYTTGCSMGDSISYFSLKGTGSSVIFNSSGAYCSTGPAGYADYTTLFVPVDIVRGECFTGFMKTGSNNNYATIWIDANDNNQFEDNERILDNLQIGIVKKLYSIYIPASMSLGIHRLRVRMMYSPLRAVHLTHSSNSYSRGEAEDYLVNITATPSVRQVAPGTPGMEQIGSETTINSNSNNNGANTWVMLMDSMNRYIAGVNGVNGGELNFGATGVKVYTHNGSIRQDINSRYYLNRDIHISSQYFDIASIRTVRFFFLNTELNALIAQPGSGVSAVFDLNCTETFRTGSSSIRSTAGIVNHLLTPLLFGSLSGDRYIDMYTNANNFYLHGGSSELVSVNPLGVVKTDVDKLPYYFTNCDNYGGVQWFRFTNDYFDTKYAYAPPEFEISFQENSGFADNLALTQVPSGYDTIFVRMKTGISADSADGEITFVNLMSEISPFKVYVRGYKPGSLQLAGSTGSMVQKTLMLFNAANVFTEPGVCKVLATLTPSGPSPVNGSATAKLWIDASTPLFGNTAFVTRHTEILPVSNPNTATGRVRLYFSQAEFTAFNVSLYSLLDLPTSPADAAGVANLRIYKFSGNSSDGSGKPYTYSSYAVINPADADIVWNAAGNYWQVDIDIAGSGHFYAGTDLTVNACATGVYRLQADNSGTTYQWQRNTGSGFVNLTNTGIHSGTTTPELIIISPLSSGYGHQYRCVVDGTPSAFVYLLKFVSTWSGKANTSWAVGGNWNACGAVPDQFTDVVIPPGLINYPVITNSRSVRSIRCETGSSVTVQTGATLTVVGN